MRNIGTTVLAQQTSTEKVPSATPFRHSHCAISNVESGEWRNVLPWFYPALPMDISLTRAVRDFTSTSRQEKLFVRTSDSDLLGQRNTSEKSYWG